MAEADIEALPDEAKAARSAQMEKRKKWLTRLAIVVAVVAVVWGLWYVFIGRFHISTDNAYVGAEMAQITPLVSAPVEDLKVTDTQPVKRGDVLVRLDPANARIAVEEARAELAKARRRFRQAVATNSALSAQVKARSADIEEAQAQLGAAEADFDKARIDLKRRQALAASGAVSGQELTDAKKAFASAKAALATAQARVAQARSNHSSAQGDLAANEALVHGSNENTDPGVLAAKAKLDAAKLDLERTVIRAPISGIVSRLHVQVGQRVEQGKPIMTIVPINRVYVDANFKERQLSRVKVGQPATVTADIYGDSVTYHGRVVGLSGGTGASMSLIPAQNATGNWIKVVQRLPVRIELDPKELAAHPLRVGLSTEVEINVSGS